MTRPVAHFAVAHRIFLLIAFAVVLLAARPSAGTAQETRPNPPAKLRAEQRGGGVAPVSSRAAQLSRDPRRVFDRFTVFELTLAGLVAEVRGGEPRFAIPFLFPSSPAAPGLRDRLANAERTVSEMRLAQEGLQRDLEAAVAAVCSARQVGDVLSARAEALEAAARLQAETTGRRFATLERAIRDSDDRASANAQEIAELRQAVMALAAVLAALLAMVAVRLAGDLVRGRRASASGPDRQDPPPAAAYAVAGPQPLTPKQASSKHGPGRGRGKEKTAGARVPPAGPANDLLAADDLFPFAAAIAARETLAIRPERSSSKCGLSVETICGHVRNENQDACLAWTQGKYKVALVADGMGGLPHGRRASRLAVHAAAHSLLRALGTKQARSIDGLAVLEAAFANAARALASHAAREGSAISAGLRTTLIALVATETMLWFGYIGDGGIRLIHPDGSEEDVLHPQKDADAANVLTASLGPVQEGAPVFDTRYRVPGEVVLFGSDGIFDRIGSEFGLDVVRVLDAEGGDLDRTVASVLRQLAESRDEYGYLCDDNMTLGALLNGAVPASMRSDGASVSAAHPTKEDSHVSAW